ncbi:MULTISPECIES: hypothetical protein [unclassified Streptomyces]|uniref:hypothetical protein n=1 Tax=unclassified Streptomyces TaxID=2593676 RepID=UPI0036E842AF
MNSSFYASFPDWAQIVLGSGISTGCILAVSLNLLFNRLGRKASSATAPEAAAIPR